MSVFAEPLTLNGVAVADMAQLGLRWSDAPLSGSVVQRLCNGQAVKQTAWRKRRLTLSAEGTVPPALADIDWSAPVTVSGPRLTPLRGFSEGPQLGFDHFAALWTWQLTIEEL